MRVAVTGGTGFLGGHLVERLLETDHEPVCLVRKTSDTTHLDGFGVETVVGSLDDPQSLRRLLQGSDAVIHGAAQVKAHRAIELHTANTEGTRSLVEAAKVEGVDRFVHISSIAAKGPAPGPEPLPATTPPAPVSYYGRSKAAAEAAVLAAQTDFSVTIVRPPVLYGPRDHAMLELFQAIQRRLFPITAPNDSRIATLYGPDCTDALIAALRHEATQPLIIEPADAPGHSWEAFRDHAAEALGVTGVRTVRPPRWLVHGLATWNSIGGRLRGKVPAFNRDKAREACCPYWVSDTTSMDALDWTPHHDLPTGVAATVEWYRREGML
jgi:2-alkyl-3-oxoalkanoate reductase